MIEVSSRNIFTGIEKPSRYAVSEGVSAHGGALTMSNDNTEIVLRGEGIDALWNLIRDGYIRPIVVDGVERVSMIDVVHVCKPKIVNPRQYWKDHKKQLLSLDWDDKASEPDPELVANLYQLKLQAPDGKMRLTDVGTFWLFVYVAGRLNQAFYKQITKGYSLAVLKYRLSNMSRGMEWRGDTNHKEMRDLDPPDPESAWADLGYLP